MALTRPRYVIKATTERDLERFYWVLQGVNGEILATSETFTSRSDARRAAKQAKVTSRLAKVGH